MDRDLKKLSRGELVELLCRLREAADELNAENSRLQARAEEAEARCATICGRFWTRSTT